MLVAHHLVVRTPLTEEKIASELFSKGTLHFQKISRFQHSPPAISNHALLFTNRCMSNVKTEVHGLDNHSRNPIIVQIMQTHLHYRRSLFTPVINELYGLSRHAVPRRNKPCR